MSEWTQEQHEYLKNVCNAFIEFPQGISTDFGRAALSEIERLQEFERRVDKAMKRLDKEVDYITKKSTAICAELKEKRLAIAALRQLVGELVIELVVWKNEAVYFERNASSNRDYITQEQLDRYNALMDKLKQEGVG